MQEIQSYLGKGAKAGTLFLFFTLAVISFKHFGAAAQLANSEPEVVVYADGALGSGWSLFEHCNGVGLCADAVLHDETDEIAIFNEKIMPGFVETGDGAEVVRDRIINEEELLDLDTFE